MKPYEISHCNVNGSTKDVVVRIELDSEDKAKLHQYHIENDGEDYDPNDVSMLVWIYIDENGEVNGYSYQEASYYPEEQGEIYYNNMFLPMQLEEECIEFVKNNYFGNEERYDC